MSGYVEEIDKCTLRKNDFKNKYSGASFIRTNQDSIQADCKFSMCNNIKFLLEHKVIQHCNGCFEILF